MTTRRGNGDGMVRQRADGRWEARMSLPNGRTKSYYGKTAKEARGKMRAAQRDQDSGVDIGAPRQTVSQFLDRWLSDVVKPNREPKTYASYEEIVRLHLQPAIGRHALGKLTPQHVAAMLRAKTDAGLSPRRVHHIRSVLRNALNQALRWGLIGRNVAALVEAPRMDNDEVDPFTPDQARAILAASHGHPLEALVRLALTMGLREGEVLGLSWKDVDLDAGRLRVRRALQRVDGVLHLKQPKTEKSRRSLRIPSPLVAALRSHQDRQTFAKRVAGAQWGVGRKQRGQPPTDDGARWTGNDLVFTTTIGTPIEPRNLIRSWHGLLDTVGLERKPFHTCRHTAASLLIAEGVPMKVVQEILGHTLISTTADIYGHLFEDAFEEAAEAMERALAG